MKKVNRTIRVIILLLLLTGCGLLQQVFAEQTSDKQAVLSDEDEHLDQSTTEDCQESEMAVDEIYKVHEIRENEKDYWEKENCPVLDDCLVDAESASSMAEVILARFQREGYFAGYTLQDIEYQSDPGIWVIHFWDSSEPDWITPEFAMAIRQDNAQVLKMWVGE